MQADWVFNVHLGTNTGKMRKAEHATTVTLTSWHEKILNHEIWRYTKINNICRAKSSLLRHFIGSQNISLKKKNRWSFKGLQSIYTKKRACSAYVVKYLRYNYSSNWILNLHAGYANNWDPLVCVCSFGLVILLQHTGSW